MSILKPIDIAITYYQSDSVPISDVFATFSNGLPKSISALTTITDEERSYMLKLNQHRFEFMYGDAHGIGYVLDPRYVGEGMPLAMRESIENLIYLHPSASVMISESDVGQPDQTSQERMFEEYRLPHCCPRIKGSQSSVADVSDDKREECQCSQVLAVTRRSVACFTEAGPTSLQHGRVERGVRAQFLDARICPLQVAQLPELWYSGTIAQTSTDKRDCKPGCTFSSHTAKHTTTTKTPAGKVIQWCAGTIFVHDLCEMGCSIPQRGGILQDG
jgi:hypothetical protein